jgi:hypothetical protein
MRGTHDEDMSDTAPAAKPRDALHELWQESYDAGLREGYRRGFARGVKAMQEEASKFDHEEKPRD